MTAIRHSLQSCTNLRAASGKVTLSKENYGALSDLAKKQIAAENKENELNAEIAKLKKENEQTTDKIAYLDQKICARV